MRLLRLLSAVFVVAALFPVAAGAQERGSISGQVLDEATGAPLSGAQIVLVGSNRGTVTNQEGRFLLAGVAFGRATLEVSFLGYRQVTQEVEVGPGAAPVTIRLAADPLLLDELVVVGYGVERRRNVAGAIASLRPEAVADIPAPSLDNVLQGRLAGVQVVQNSGAPGAAITVRVRGSSSISAGNQPLYVVDGVPVTQGNFSGFGTGTYGGQGIDALSDLDPNEIESIEVLKDASAAAIYGSRASNGVVLITTKRGRVQDRPDIRFNAYTGFQRDWNRVEYLNTEEYVEVLNEGIRNAGIHPAYIGFLGEDDPDEHGMLVDRNISTDWLDQVLRTAPISAMSGSIAGGTDRARYYVSGSLFDQEGIVLGSGFERLSGRLNLDYVATDRLALGTNIALARSVHRRVRGDNTIFGPFANAIANPPFQPVYDEDGNYADTHYANPVGLAKENTGEERGIRILGNAFANYTLLPGVNARVSVGLDQLNLRSRLYDSPIVGVGVGTNGQASARDAYVTKLTYEGTVNWLRDLGSAHSLSGVIGASYEENTTERTQIDGQQFPTAYFRHLDAAAEITGGQTSLTNWSIISYFSRLSYSYADRYTLTFNVRTDGSSRFGEDNRYGIFPSASLLWRASEESFLRDQDVVRNLALRVSYGRTGNQFGIDDFAARGLFESGHNYAGQPGLAPTQLANPELKWETTDQFNVGADFAFLTDRLSFSIDYYDKKTNDLLVERPIPMTTGYASYWSNVGALQNRGIEIMARAQILQGGLDGLNWSADLNISRNRNKVTELYRDEPIMTGFVSRVQVGQPIGVFYGYVTDGIFRNQAEVDAHAFQTDGTAPGDIRFKDLNGDGVINDEDRTVIGSPWPDFEGGLTNTLSYKGFDLNVFVQFSYGNEIYNGNRIYQEAYGTYFDNATKRALKRWTPENPDATEPRAIYDDPNDNARDSDRFVEDGSYLRVKNAVLGYTVPQSLASRLGFRSLRLYVQGQNLLTFTKYSGFDPEVNFGGNANITRGTDFYTMPQARTFTAGVNIGL